MASGKSCTLAEFTGSKWSMVNSPWSVKLPNSNNDDGHIFELIGPHTVSILIIFSYAEKLPKNEYYLDVHGVFLCIGKVFPRWKVGLRFKQSR